MATTLQNIGTFSYRRRRLVLVTWIVILAIAAGLAVKFYRKPSDAISIPGTQAQQALDLANSVFPGTDGATGKIVFRAPAGTTVAKYAPEISDVAAQAKSVSGVTSVISPLQYAAAVSPDGRTAYMQVQLSTQASDITVQTTQRFADIIAGQRKDGLQIELGGDIVSSDPGEILGAGEATGVGIALLVLVMTFGSLVAAGMPLVTALLTVALSTAGLFALSHKVDVNSTTPILGVMLGLAVGIDYSLFLISKYRAYLVEGFGPERAAGRTIATAGNAVVFAASTVVIALAALSVVRIPFMTSMGLSGAAAIALAAIVAITLVPALLGFAGDRVLTRKMRTKLPAAQATTSGISGHSQSAWYRWGDWIAAHPALVLAVALAAIIAAALPARNLTLGLPGDEYAATGTTQRKAYDLLSQGFGPGFNGPLLIFVQGLPKVTAADQAAVKQSLLSQYETQLKDQSSAAGTLSAQQLQAEQAAATAKLDAEAAQYAPLYNLQSLAARIGQRSDVQQAIAAKATGDGRDGIIEVIPRSGPADSATENLITDLRDNGTSITGNASTKLYVTGATAVRIDIDKKLLDALPEYLAVVVGLSLILLILAFRSILVPIKATLGFLLSVGVMFGALVEIVQDGRFGLFSPMPIISFLPIISIGILFGLAMDYEFFLVSSMHEAYGRTRDARRAVVDGFAQGSKVVTAAAVIMTAVFSGFISNGQVTIQMVGLGLAVGVFTDAFVVRMTVVPAVMSLLGRSAWWLPRWLERILPKVSIEGK